MAARTPLLLACGLLAVLQLSMSCDNCMAHGGLGPEARRTMLRAHSAACVRESGAAPEEARALEAGPPPAPSRAQRLLLYCVLRRCDMIGSDGRPRRVPELMAVSKCGHNDGDTPEDEAWNLFFCSCGDSDLGSAGEATTTTDAAAHRPAAAAPSPAGPESLHINESNATSSLPAY